jgi:hypothetical protein
MSRKLVLGAALALAGVVCIAQAHARPPTVLNSPGYDRALQESRKNYLRAAGSEPVQTAPVKKKSKRKPKN